MPNRLNSAMKLGNLTSRPNGLQLLTAVIESMFGIKRILRGSNKTSPSKNGSSVLEAVVTLLGPRLRACIRLNYLQERAPAMK